MTVQAYDVNNLPTLNTLVRPLKGRNGMDFSGRYARPDGLAYVASHTYSNDAKSYGMIVVSDQKDREHGGYCSEWEVVEPAKPEKGALSDKQKQALTDQALEAATKRGYCNETKNILRDLGLPTEATKYVTIRVKEDDIAGGEVKVKVDGKKVKHEVVAA